MRARGMVTVRMTASALEISERSWLLPSAALTMLSGCFVIAAIPDYSGVIPALLILPFWLIAATIIASSYALARMIASGVKDPVHQIVKFLSAERRRAIFLAACLAIAGLNMVSFMLVKPMLNYMVHFWADPFLAEIDRALFLGHDPWRFLSWLNSRPFAIFYHRGWFAMMILTLLVVLRASPSAERSAVLLSYFVLWSLLAPLIHTLLPAAGPIFYSQMGYGDRFAGLQAVSETKEAAEYLWIVYSGQGFGPGSGISAMPSMHIATTAWMIIAFYVLARRWLVPIAVAGVLIFLLSISLGWHYAIDGIVGAACAALCYTMLRAYYRREHWRRSLGPALAASPI